MNQARNLLKAALRSRGATRRHRRERCDAAPAGDLRVRRPTWASPLLAAVVWTLAVAVPAHQTPPTAEARHTVTAERPMMGTVFRIEVVVDDETQGAAAVEAAFAEVERGEEILSNWSETSQITALNRLAGSGPVRVSSDLMRVLERALTISSLTDGAFDITFASCEGLWSIRERRIPRTDEIDACLTHVDYRRVSLDHMSSVVLVKDPRTRIGLAALAKGFRVDRAAEVLLRHGITDFAIDGGGDIRLSTSDGGPSWPIRVAHPRRPGASLGELSLRNVSVATSGDYQWFFERDGVRYHHILDPKSGRPARQAMAATVIAATATDADALATGLFVMGPELGIALVESLPGVEALIVAPDQTLYLSSGFPDLSPTEPPSS